MSFPSRRESEILSAEVASIRKDADSLSERLTEVETVARRLLDQRVRALRKLEELRLKRGFWSLLSVLAVVTVVAAVVILELIEGAASEKADATLILSTVGGVLGSAVAAMLSLLQRRANGFAFSDGSKFPVGGKPDRFSAAMCPFLLARPLLGAPVGLLLGAGIWSGILWPGEAKPETMTFCFATVLGGFLAKTALDKLKQVFSNLLGLG